MKPDPEQSYGGDATSPGRARARREAVSQGDEATNPGLGRLAGPGGGIDGAIDEDFASRYTIEGKLGQGGMGAVLLATDNRLGRKVAIKRILGEAAGNRLAVARFLNEAKAVAALNHPNIVQIYDYGRAADGPFLIMEYVDGGSLLDRCKAGPIQLDEAIDLACQICDGLAKAHDQQIIHRDIKPANVLLTKDGTPKLTDFGLAKAQAGNHGHSITGSGAILGTPDFMPPEQQRDAALVDHRSDLWSLAATLYQMVTGRSPRIIRLSDLPATLQDFLAKALEEDKDARFQSTREFRDALKQGLRSTAGRAAEIEVGKCPACGAANDQSRKFCRGCGGSLVAPCLSCGQAMPLWDEICGDCGARQTPLVDSRRAELAAAQAKAEGLLGDLEFVRATEIARELSAAAREHGSDVHPRLAFVETWAEKFLADIARARELQAARVAEALAAASKHDKAGDHAAAIAVLEAVPVNLRRTSFDDRSETIEATLSRVRRKLADKEMRAEAQREAARVDRAIAAAAARMREFDFVGVEQALATSPPIHDNAEATRLRQAARAALERIAILEVKLWPAEFWPADAPEDASASDIFDVVSDDSVDEDGGLSDDSTIVYGDDEHIRAAWADELLSLQPNHSRALALKEELAERLRRIGPLQEAALEAVRSHMLAGDFASAVREGDAGMALAPHHAPDELANLLTRARNLLAQSRSLQDRIDAAVACDDFDAAERLLIDYAAVAPADGRIGPLREAVERGRMGLQQRRLAGQIRQIVARLDAKRIAAERRALHERAGALLAAHRYAEAEQAIAAATTDIACPELRSLMATARDRNNRVTTLRRAVRAAVTERRFDDVLLGLVRELLELSPNEPQMADLAERLVRERRRREETNAAIGGEVAALLSLGSWKEAGDALLKAPMQRESEISRSWELVIARREREFADLQAKRKEIEASETESLTRIRVVSLAWCIVGTVAAYFGPVFGLAGYARVVAGMAAATAMADALLGLLTGGFGSPGSHRTKEDEQYRGCLVAVLSLAGIAVFVTEFVTLISRRPVGAWALGLLTGLLPAAILVYRQSSRSGRVRLDLALAIKRIEDHRLNTGRFAAANPTHPLAAIERELEAAKARERQAAKARERQAAEAREREAAAARNKIVLCDGTELPAASGSVYDPLPSDEE